MRPGSLMGTLLRPWSPRGAVALAAAVLLWTACLPRLNPFDVEGVEDAYNVRVKAVSGSLEVSFDRLGGEGIRAYRVYREDVRGDRVLVAELPPNQSTVVDGNAAAASEQAGTALEDDTLFWRVAGVTEGGEGPMSNRRDVASTRVLPSTTIEPAPPEYISGQSSVAVLVRVAPSTLAGRPGARLFQYRFRGGEWTDPIVAGPLVLTGLLDGRYTLEVAAVDDNGDADITPARASFIYDFNVPEGTTCTPAVCNAGLTCVEEPVGNFCRRLCAPADADGGAAGCAEGLTCRLGSGVGGQGACVVVSLRGGRCDDRLCADGLACGDTGDGRQLCGVPCGAGESCDAGQVCHAGPRGDRACLTDARLNEGCLQSACAEDLACENAEDNPRCRRVCQSTINCGGGQVCTDLGRADLKICL